MATILINVALAVAWSAMTGSFTFVNMVFGFVLGGVALLLIREQSGGAMHFRRTLAAVDLAAVFVWELLKSTAAVARIVLSGRKLSPAIVAYPLSVTTDPEITLLANMITLTPGTLSVDVTDDRTVLFVHAIDAPDPDDVIAGIKKSFEQRIAKVFHG